MPDINFPDTVGSIVIGIAGAVLDGKPDALTFSVITGECGQLVSGCRRNASADQFGNPAGILLRVIHTEGLMCIIGHTEQNMTAVRVCKCGHGFQPTLRLPFFQCQLVIQVRSLYFSEIKHAYHILCCGL